MLARAGAAGSDQGSTLSIFWLGAPLSSHNISPQNGFSSSADTPWAGPTYASRTKGRWSQMPHVAEHTPEGWKASHPEAAPHADDPGFEPLPHGQEVDINSRKRAWARLLAKIYEDCAPRWTPSCAPNAEAK